ncbi:MAG: dihydroorotate dehydrogenase electron transfer subunit [Sedimentisphaerales bacterium]|nr:dihydroorotate dehydrogenase electron transfer subunit [Sedimentisphaerales bacterium]
MLDLTQTALPAQEKIPDSLKDTVKRQLILRRPFSFSDVSVGQGENGPVVKLEIMYCVLGPSTVRMTSLSKGDKINVLGPLGNGFNILPDKELSILIAGGMGAPPLLHMASVLKKLSTKVLVFAGARSCDDLPFTIRIGNITGLVLEEFWQLGVDCQIATDDGSAGFKGYVTACAEKWLSQNTWNPEKTAIYACGPEVMLAEAAKLAFKHNVPCQVSMERMMACGIGLCQSCAIEHKTAQPQQTEYKLCCKEGPVFDARDVVFSKEG